MLQKITMKNLRHYNCLEEVIKNIDFASENKNIPFVVFKFSGIEKINILDRTFTTTD